MRSDSSRSGSTNPSKVVVRVSINITPALLIRILTLALALARSHLQKQDANKADEVYAEKMRFGLPEAIRAAWHARALWPSNTKLHRWAAMSEAGRPHRCPRMLPVMTTKLRSNRPCASRPRGLEKRSAEHHRDRPGFVLVRLGGNET